MILYADLDAYFASVEQALDPKLKGKPVVVAGDPAKRHGVVATASYEAREFGVHSAQPVWEAKKICPDCIFIRPHYKIYGKFSRIFYSILEKYSPDIEKISLDEAFIDIEKTEGLFGNPLEIGRKIKKETRNRLDINVTVSIAISKIVSKIAADREKPDGLILIPRGEEVDYIFPLPIEEFPGIGKKTGGKLKSMNIRTIGDLMDYPEKEIYRVFGINGIRWVRDIKKETLESSPERKSVSKSKTLPEDTCDRDKINALLHYLTEKVSLKLQKLNLHATKISVTAKKPDFSRSKEWKRMPPSNSSRDIYPVAKNILENLQVRWIRLLRVRASELTKMSSLFQDDKKVTLDNKIREIRKNYGFNSILPLSCYNLEV